MVYKVAVIAYVHVGHLNPLMPMVRELVDRGVMVTFYSEASVKDAILATGAKYKSLYASIFDDETTSPDEYFNEWRAKNGENNDEFPLQRIQEAYLYLDALMEDLKDEAPDVIFHDTFCVEALVASERLKIPLVSHITYSGLGIMGNREFMKQLGRNWDDMMAEPVFKRWQEAYQKKFDVDIWEDSLPMQYYSKDLMITTMIPELCAELNEEDGIPYTRFKDRAENNQVFVGQSFDPRHRINGKPYETPSKEFVEDCPLRQIKKAKEEGRKIILVSLGTVITQNLWDVPQFPCGGVDSGKEYFRAVMGAAVAAFAEDKDFTVVVATGWKANGLELDVPTPSNFIVRKRLNQTQLLSLADAFISHMGANSMNESLSAGVPLVPVPGFADQSVNGRLTVEAGAAFAEWDQYKCGAEITSDNLRRSILKVINEPSFKRKAEHLGTLNKSMGGQKYAADLIINFMKDRTLDVASSKKPFTSALENSESKVVVETKE